MMCNIVPDWVPIVIGMFKIPVDTVSVLNKSRIRRKRDFGPIFREFSSFDNNFCSFCMKMSGLFHWSSKNYVIEKKI